MRARLERVRHVADEDGDRSGWQHLAVQELGREPEDGATEGVDQQQLNEIVEGEAEEPIDVPADDPTHTHMLLVRYDARLSTSFGCSSSRSDAIVAAIVDDPSDSSTAQWRMRHYGYGASVAAQHSSSEPGRFRR